MERGGKEQIVGELTEKFSRAKSIIFCEYKGLTVKGVNSLRRTCRNAGIDYIVAKNTLIYISLPEAVRDKVKDTLVQTTAVAVDYGDGVTVAKVLANFAKEYPTLKPKAGVLDNEFLTAAKVDALAKLPSREELLSKILGSIQAPARNVLGCVNGVGTKLAGLLHAYKEKLQEAA